VQVIFDGTRAHEEPGGDLGGGQALAGQPDNLSLPGGELSRGLGGAFADALAGGAVVGAADNADANPALRRAAGAPIRS
jgi:hypothetical protein